MEKKDKIFIVYNSYLNSKSGSNTHIIELITNMRKIANIIFFFPNNKNIGYNFKEMVGVPIIHNKYIDVLFYQFSLLIYLVYYCIKDKPDIIYARQDNLSISSLIVAKIFRVPYVVEVNGFLLDEVKMFKRPLVYIKLSTISEKLNYKHCTKIVTVTEGIKREIVKLYKITDEKIVVINNGANTNIFYQMDLKNCRNKLNLDNTKIYVCFVGHLTPWQGVEYLIQAAPFILSAYLNVNFLIVGGGTKKRELIQLAYELNVADYFIFTDSVPYTRVPLYINASDICVAPFIVARNAKIGLSALKMYEYMACGKSVVASDILGVGDLLRKSNGGIEVAPENPLELANGILKLLIDENLRRQMGRSGYQFIIENHTWENVAKKVICVCKQSMKYAEK